MASLQWWASVAEVAGLVALVGGAIFAWYQIREARRARSETSALTVLKSFLGDEEFFEAIKRLMALPANWHDDPKARSNKENIKAAEKVYSTHEMIGYFVYVRAVPLRHVAALAGGGMIRAWEQMEGYVRQEQEVRGPNAFEWFEWLAVQLRRVHSSPVPAVERYNDWRP